MAPPYPQPTVTANSGFYTFGTLPPPGQNQGAYDYTTDVGPVWCNGSIWSGISPFAGQTSAEIAAGVLVINPAYSEGDIRRYAVAPGTGNDDTAAINATLSVASKSGRPAFFSGLNLKSTGSIVRDVGSTGVDFLGGGIDFTSMGTTGTAWQDTCTTGSGSAQNVLHARYPMMNGYLTGQNAGSTVGLSINDTSEPSASFLNYHNMVFEQFNTACAIGNNAYILKFFGCYFSRSGTGLSIPNALTNAAEQIFVSGGGFTDCSSIGVDNQNGNTDLVLHSCSIDGNNIIFYRGNNGSRTYMKDCHIEMLAGASQTTTPIQVEGNNCILNIDGGSILADGTTPFPYAAVFDIASGARVILGGGVLINNLANTAGVLCSGAGSIFIRPGETATYNSGLNPIIVGTGGNFNLLADGAFAQASLQDNIALGSDTATITSRTAGTNISISRGTNGATPALAAVKAGGVGTTAGVVILTPCQPGQRMAASGQYAASSSLTNNVFLFGAFANVVYGANGVPIFLKFALQTGASITTLSTTFVNFNTGGQFVAPPWANCFLLNCNLNGLAAATFYLTNLVITGS